MFLSIKNRKNNTYFIRKSDIRLIDISDYSVRIKTDYEEHKFDINPSEINSLNSQLYDFSNKIFFRATKTGE